MERDTHYDILGVPPSSSQDEIKAGYRKLIQRIHPDLDGPVALFRQVQEAYEVLSDPTRRRGYDRSLETGARTATGDGNGAATPRQGAARQSPSQARPTARQARSKEPRPSTRTTRNGPSRNATRGDTVQSFMRQYPARVAAVAGAGLLALGAALGSVGQSILLIVGVIVLLLAAIAGLGARGVKEYEAYRRSGMEAVDGMTGRQFALLLEHCFADKGYRVSRLGTRGHAGADLLLDDSHGRTVVQVRRWQGVVHHDAVQQVALAKVHYGVPRALVVTSSNYSEHAVTVANSSGVTLWDRANVAVELAALRDPQHQSAVVQFSWGLRAGARICQGFVAALFVMLLAASSGQRRRRTARKGK